MPLIRPLGNTLSGPCRKRPWLAVRAALAVSQPAARRNEQLIPSQAERRKPHIFNQRSYPQRTCHHYGSWSTLTNMIAGPENTLSCRGRVDRSVTSRRRALTDERFFR